MPSLPLSAGSSRSLEVVRASLDSALGAGADPAALADELFGVVSVLDGAPALRRVLTEPSVSAEARDRLVTQVFEGKVASATLDIARAAVRERWSRGRDLPDALEITAVSACAAGAEAVGELDRLEDELFRLGRILEANPDLRDTLSDEAVPVDARRGLIDGLLRSKVCLVTSELVDQLLLLRHHSLAVGLMFYQQGVASRRKRLVATVWAASQLSGDHKERLAAALARDYSHEVHVNVVVDPAVLGGLRVSIGDDVIDSTVETRIAQARQRLLR